MAGEIIVQVDWNKDNDFSDTTENVSSLVRRQAGLSFEYGRDQSTALAPTVAGRGGFTLNNVNKQFSPRNTGSPIYPNVKPARPVRVLRTTGDIAPSETLFPSATLFPDGNEYTMFVGHTDDSPINPDVDTKSVQLSLVDSLADFRGFNLSTDLYAGLRTGQAIGIILDQIGWTGGRDLDSGATVLPWWWEEGTDAFTALETLIRCEGPPAMLTMGADGSLIFKDRHHRLLDAASTTSQDTWGISGSAEPVMNVPFVYDDAWRNIINHGTVSVGVRQPQGIEVVWTIDSPISFGPNETQTFIATASDPFMNAITPNTLDVDYTILSGALASLELSTTSGASTVITAIATAAGCQIDRLQLRAIPVQVAFTQTVTRSDTTSIADYGPRSFQGDLEFCSPYDAEAVLSTAVDQRANPLPIVTVRFLLGSNTDRTDSILPRNLSDRVTIVEPETSVDDDFYIESFVHDAPSQGVYDHDVVIGLEAVPANATVTASNVFIIGSTAVGHRIGSGLLAP